MVRQRQKKQNKNVSDLEVRLKNRLRFTSLKTLCVRKVVETLPKYAKHGLTNLFSVLPKKSLSSLVYQECLQSFKDNRELPWMNEWRFCDLKNRVNLLAGSKLEEFDCMILNLLRPLQHNCDYKDFEQFAKESPKLKSFKDNCRDMHKNYDYRGQLLSDFYSLKTMSSLVVLELKCYPARDADLQVIGTCLPLLQRLMLLAPSKFGEFASNISYQALEYLTNLTFLKHLTIVFDNVKLQENVEVVTNCLQLMPKVNTVGTSSGDKPSFILHQFPSYKDPVELGLEHLVLGPKSVIPSNVTLPDVNRVTVLEMLTVSLQQFKKLRSLCLQKLDEDDFNWDQFEQALIAIGPLLRTLDLSWYMSRGLITRVLKFCPNLEELTLNRMLFLDNFATAELKDCVKKLKRFKHDYLYNLVEFEYFNSNGLLHLLLTSCPELEELQVQAIRLTDTEMDLINHKINFGKLSIKKLQKVEILAYVDEDALVSFGQFASKLCVKNFKILKKVDINHCANIINDIPELEVAVHMQERINNTYNFRKR